MIFLYVALAFAVSTLFEGWIFMICFGMLHGSVKGFDFVPLIGYGDAVQLSLITSLLMVPFAMSLSAGRELSK